MMKRDATATYTAITEHMLSMVTGVPEVMLPIDDVVEVN